MVGCLQIEFFVCVPGEILEYKGSTLSWKAERLLVSSAGEESAI